MAQSELKSIGSLITYCDGGEETTLGYLRVRDCGIFDDTIGLVNISVEDATTHNALLDEAFFKDLDENCAIGQHGTVFHAIGDGKIKVKTWCGTIVSEDAHKVGNVLVFTRNKMVFRGIVHTDAGCFTFKRVA